MAFPHLRVQQTRADDLIRPEYVLPDNRTHPDDGLPRPGWPRGVTWVAHVGQPVQGPLGGRLSPADGHYRDVVEVTARTGHYGPVWHRLGVPTNLARILSEERQARALLIKGRTSVETIAYLRIAYQKARPEDPMERLYHDRLRTEAGNGYPVPPPRPDGIQEPSEAAGGGDDDKDLGGGSGDGGREDRGGGGGGGGAAKGAREASPGRLA